MLYFFANKIVSKANKIGIESHRINVYVYGNYVLMVCEYNLRMKLLPIKSHSKCNTEQNSFVNAVFSCKSFTNLTFLLNSNGKVLTYAISSLSA